jgi:DNA-binding XRE family transcriptional regulator
MAQIKVTSYMRSEIREKYTSFRISQAELAKQYGLSRKTVNEIVSGYSRPTLSTEHRRELARARRHRRYHKTAERERCAADYEYKLRDPEYRKTVRRQLALYKWQNLKDPEAQEYVKSELTKLNEAYPHD